MFNGGVPDQFHQFIASRTPSSSPLPAALSFPLHGSTHGFPSFDPLFPSHHQAGVLQLQPQVHLLPQLHHPISPPANQQQEEKEVVNSLLSTSSEPDREGSIDPWSNEEVLALLKVRSTTENWFPEFTWQHVSRKLVELGYKRSAEKCKEKFEEESSRHFNNSISYSKSFRFFSELEELCHGDHQQDCTDKVLAETDRINVEEKLPSEELERVGQISLEVTEDYSKDDENNETEPKDKKRKRHDYWKYEMLKGFCEEIVNKMMAQQEELHNKIIEDMVKRDEEKIEREVAWKKKEMKRINKEIELRAHEQAVAGDRQSKLIEFLKKFSSNSSDIFQPSHSCSSTSHSFFQLQNPNPICQPNVQNETNVAHNNADQGTTDVTFRTPLAPNNNLEVATFNTSITTSSTDHSLAPQSSTKLPKSPQNPNLGHNESGKRWPRDEVLTLINLRCSLNSGGPDQEKEIMGAKGGPLWERISQGMLERGYKRSAKRCKEKWENINKYFRKTKDVNKKRSLDSRTCPYFHQLSSLYSQGTLVAPPDGLENHSPAPENHPDISETPLGPRV